MASVIEGTEVKLRINELVDLNGRLDDGHAAAFDSPTGGPGFATPKVFTERGIAKLSYGLEPVPPPTNPDVSQIPRLPVAIGNRVKIYPIADVVAGVGAQYLGPKQFPPTADNYGNPLVVGATYYNTTNLVVYVWSPSLRWTPFSAAAPGALSAYYYLPVVPTSVLPVGGPLTPDARGNILSFTLGGLPQDVDPINLYYNGALLCNGVDYVLTEGGSAGDYATLLRPAVAGSVVVIQVMGAPTVQFGASAVSINTAGWIANGTNKTYPLANFSGGLVVPGSTTNCLVVVDGRALDPTDEFTVAGSNITFTIAPAIGAQIWVTVGLPISSANALIAEMQADIADLQSRVAALEAA